MRGDDVFRCAYCGELVPLDRSTIYWTWVEELDSGQNHYTAAVYCSGYCGSQHSRGSVGRS